MHSILNKQKWIQTKSLNIKIHQKKAVATICELQKIMNIEVPLNVQHFKTYELKKKQEIKVLLNVHNFKTKSPFDKLSIPYDRGLHNTAFVEKMMRAPPCVGAFQKSPDEN